MIVARPDLTTRVRSTASRETLTEIVVVCACDDNYSMPLAVMLHSAAKNLGADCCLTIYFIDGGISESAWEAIRETLAGLPINVFSIQPDYSLVDHLHTSHHVTPAAYLRLLTAEIIPDHIKKAIYLDSDVLVCDDLAKLWELSLENHYCLAAPDIACPFVDARIGCSNFRQVSPWLATHRPIPNYRELGLDPNGEYFNSGVMVLNLDLWRCDQVAIRMLECLENNREHIWCWDQYALNVVFHGRWGRLPVRWNLGTHALEYPTPAASPVGRVEFDSMLDDPGIIHFTTEFKPWHYHWTHLRGEQFFAALDETAYRGWRPRDPGFSWSEFQKRQTVNLIKWLTIQYRKVASIWEVRSR